jgi:hypothetical protein
MNLVVRRDSMCDVGALDRGGYTEFADARAFALGVDWVRAAAGILGDLDARDIDQERATQDADQRCRPRGRRPDHPLFEAA